MKSMMINVDALKRDQAYLFRYLTLKLACDCSIDKRKSRGFSQYRKLALSTGTLIGFVGDNPKQGWRYL